METIKLWELIELIAQESPGLMKYLVPLALITIPVLIIIGFPAILACASTYVAANFVCTMFVCKLIYDWKIKR